MCHIPDIQKINYLLQKQIMYTNQQYNHHPEGQFWFGQALQDAGQALAGLHTTQDCENVSLPLAQAVKTGITKMFNVIIQSGHNGNKLILETAAYLYLKITFKIL